MMIDVMGSLKKRKEGINQSINSSIIINHHQPIVNITGCFFGIVVAATRKPLLFVWHPPRDHPPTGVGPLPPLPGAAQRIQSFKTLMW